MKEIYKYHIPFNINSTLDMAISVIDLPIGFRYLNIKIQNKELYLWVMESKYRDRDKDKVILVQKKYFIRLSTNIEIPDNLADRLHHLKSFNFLLDQDKTFINHHPDNYIDAHIFEYIGYKHINSNPWDNIEKLK